LSRCPQGNDEIIGYVRYWIQNTRQSKPDVALSRRGQHSLKRRFLLRFREFLTFLFLEKQSDYFLAQSGRWRFSILPAVALPMLGE
jgi:hypothetical protein